ncbi:AMINO ACID TRANSPORTER [Salix purpurea]|uniref:AMINO ACID TRANSPORTER n=1 Tax=Salix purpurea TaxID=77065 RepID=A0A9Q1AC54_SALPP|nr:AMINO ACID TRANSPORTER [Salix purpurea]
MFGRVLGLCMASISLLYEGFGVLGYFAFGDDTKNIIITNLGLGLLSNLVQIGLCMNLLFTFPLMMNPVYEVCEPILVQIPFGEDWFMLPALFHLLVFKEELGWNGLLLDMAFVVFGVIIAVADT